MPRTFAQDATALERRYYRLARDFHPDKFAGQAADERSKAMDVMGKVNRAYEILKDPDARRLHLIALERARTGTPARISEALPADLAEEWFEVRESDEGRALDAFSRKLQELKAESGRKLSALESEYDRSHDAGVLDRIEGEAQSRNYLGSLEREVRKLCH